MMDSEGPGGHPEVFAGSERCDRVTDCYEQLIVIEVIENWPPLVDAGLDVEFPRARWAPTRLARR